MTTLRRLIVLPLALAIGLGPAVACKSARRDPGPGSNPVVASAIPALPSLTVRDDSTGLTFSWITLDGGFQLVSKVADVPYEARDAVRVWSEVSGDGIAGPWVYVADLRNKLADGTYKVEVQPRTQFEALAEDRRTKSKKAGGAAPVAQKGKPDEPTAPGENQVKDGKKVKVIIYGADWCKPCHLAENYLRSKGVPFEHRDIDDPEVNEEMRIKLDSVGIKTHSIPILDVAGKLLVGFSEAELEKALAAAGAG
ncbi:MAG: NrdH-redoxin [Deltaproteobacteria bacterium]|nr:NrdH-redoxin [Deltaproteobacteria bacterium]